MNSGAACPERSRREVRVTSCGVNTDVARSLAYGKDEANLDVFAHEFALALEFEFSYHILVIPSDYGVEEFSPSD